MISIHLQCFNHKSKYMPPEKDALSVSRKFENCFVSSLATALRVASLCFCYIARIIVCALPGADIALFLSRSYSYSSYSSRSRSRSPGRSYRRDYRRRKGYSRRERYRTKYSSDRLVEGYLKTCM